MRNGNLTGPISCPREEESGYFLLFSDNTDMLERQERRIRIASRLVTTAPLELPDVTPPPSPPPNPAATGATTGIPLTSDSTTEEFVAATVSDRDERLGRTIQQTTDRVFALVS